MNPEERLRYEQKHDRMGFFGIDTKIEKSSELG